MIDTRKYKTLWFYLLIGSLSILPTPGHASPGLTGTDLLELCVSRLTIPETQCLAFISGVTAGHALSVGAGKTFYCFPENADIAQAKRIIVKYLKKNASSLDKDAAELIFRALADAWPCGN
ncbi:MAG: Rap1a/Tai family immunity protein [Gammaproteobacteria bacterium]|jgi:hypothetical protein|nr:Rap1a/Tai family immunity protein [Gammaproteobacteria bacterium]